MDTRVLLAVFLLPCASAERITGPRPLSDLADRLEAAWGRPITYEEPLWRHSSDVSSEGDPVLKTFAPRFRGVRLPAAALANRDRKRDLEHTRAIIAAFNREYAPLQFAVHESRWGLHIIPVQNKDPLGTPVASNVLLDAAVTVPRDARPATLHLEALARSLGWREGIRVSGSSPLMRFDQLFAGANASPVFEWGASNVKGRDALLDLLSRGAVLCSWRLNCQPATPGVQSAFCVLHVTRVGSGSQSIRSPALK
jgi:hypothetical protein